MKYIRSYKINNHKKNTLKSRSRAFKFVFYAIVVLSILLYTLFNFFKISTVLIRTEDNRYKGIITKYSEEIGNVVSGYNIFLFNKSYILINSNNRDLKFTITKYEKKYPKTLVLYIEPSAKSSVKVRSDGFLFVINKDGMVLYKEDNNLRKKIFANFNKKFSVGDLIDVSVITTLKSLSESDQYTNFKKIDVNEKYVKILYKEGFIVLFPILNDENMISDKLMLLKKIVQQYTIDSRSIDTIDIRYSKPVIKFK